MDRRLFPIDDIHISKKRRAPDMARVASIAESIGDVGLMNPPAVCIRNDVVLADGEVCDAVPVLIYGHHRLLALKQRGEVAVECVVYEVDDLHAELMEIDENLARSELTAAEEAACIRRRQEIWEDIHGSPKANGARAANAAMGRGGASEKFSVAFTTDTAAASGKTDRSIRMAAARGRELGADIHRIVGTSLDKGVEMDALIKLPKDERADLISRAASGEAVSARPAAVPRPVPADQALNVIAKGIVADSHTDEDEEERQFWVFFASLSPAVQRKVIAKFKAR
jgi:ParB family chromosome partitioning protein